MNFMGSFFLGNGILRYFMSFGTFYVNKLKSRILLGNVSVFGSSKLKPAGLEMRLEFYYEPFSYAFSLEYLKTLSFHKKNH